MHDQSSKTKPLLDTRSKTELEPYRMSSLYTTRDSGSSLTDSREIYKSYIPPNDPSRYNSINATRLVSGTDQLIQDNKQDDQSKSDSNGIFITHLLLTTKIQRLMDENDELRRKIKDLLVS